MGGEVGASAQGVGCDSKGGEKWLEVMLPACTNDLGILFSLLIEKWELLNPFLSLS